jgi:uncharacterized integral membrane protein
VIVMERRPTERERVFAGTGLFWGLIVVLLLGVAIVILAAQNPEPVELRWLGFEIEVSLVAIILATAVVAVILDQLIGLAWRRRRRQQLGDREELRRLRAERREAPVRSEEPAVEQHPDEPAEGGVDEG